jgi:hypothetical protein
MPSKGILVAALYVTSPAQWPLTLVAQQDRPPGHYQMFADPTPDCDDADIGQVCLKTRATVCQQPVGASVVPNDPQACEHEVKKQVQIKTDVGRKIWVETCRRQTKIWRQE